MDKNWPKWITASLNMHFSNGLVGTGIEYRMPGGVLTKENSIELRFNGPDIYESTSRQFILTTSLNILVQTVKDSDLYRLSRNVGLIAKLFNNGIRVKKYGNTSDDDESEIGCLQLIQMPIRIQHFGQIDPSIDVYQSTVAGDYRLELSL